MVEYLSRGMHRIFVDCPAVLLPLNKTAYKHSRADWAVDIDFQPHSSLFFKSVLSCAISRRINVYGHYGTI